MWIDVIIMSIAIFAFAFIFFKKHFKKNPDYNYIVALLPSMVCTMMVYGVTDKCIGKPALFGGCRFIYLWISILCISYCAISIFNKICGVKR